MPRIAVQFFGHLRTFNKCLPYLRKHLLNNYDCDIFMHTWDKYNHNTQTWHTNFKNVNKNVDKDEIIKQLKIKPEQIKTETQGIYSTDKYIARGREWGLQGLISMYRSMKAVNDLRENYQKKHNIKYDFVVCIRPDILLKEDLNLEEFINDEQNVNGNNFYIPGRVPNRNIYGFNCMEVVDLLFFAKPEAMTKFCSGLTPPIKKGDKVDYAPDGFLVDNINRAKLNPVFVASYQYDKSFKIKRYPQIILNRSNIISFHLRKYGIYLHILRVLPPIMNFDFNIFNWFHLVFSVGKFD